MGAKLISPIVRHVEHRTVAIEKHERLGLMVFVAIPLPWTGAWTGSMVVASLHDVQTCLLLYYCRGDYQRGYRYSFGVVRLGRSCCCRPRSVSE